MVNFKNILITAVIFAESAHLSFGQIEHNARFNTKLTGVPTAPTAPLNTNSNQIANTAFVVSQLAGKVNTSALAPVATSGVYNDLTGKPAPLSNATIATALGFTPANAANPVEQKSKIGVLTNNVFIDSDFYHNGYFSKPDSGTIFFINQIDSSTTDTYCFVITGPSLSFKSNAVSMLIRHVSKDGTQTLIPFQSTLSFAPAVNEVTICRVIRFPNEWLVVEF
jgi:hypothetical protein